MNLIYDILLQGIRSHIKITNEKSFIDYLQSLKPFVCNLRRSYQTHCVQVDYSDFRTQSAYLITYFPQYVEMTLYVLRELDRAKLAQSFGQRSTIQGCFFGSGPFPEAVGLGIYLRENFPECQNLRLLSCDIMATLWEPSRNISISRVLPKFFRGGIHSSAHNFDMLSNDSLHIISDYLCKSNLVVFQNCLNELDGKLSIFIENMDYILSQIPSSSLLILADLGQYAIVSSLMQQVRDNIHQLNSVEIIQEGEKRFRSMIDLPGYVSKYVLTGESGLMPRKNIYTRYLVARKN